METAIRHISAAGRREELVVGMLTYAHNAFLTEHYFRKGLTAAGLEYADVLLLGYFPRQPSRRIIDGALDLKEKGMVALHRPDRPQPQNYSPSCALTGHFDVFHIRYNAVHRGGGNRNLPPPGRGCLPAAGRGQLYRHGLAQNCSNPAKMPPGETAPHGSRMLPLCPVPTQWWMCV